MTLTQHAAGHQDVEERLCIPAVVKFGARGIKELCNRLQISASLIQALYDTFLKLSRVKSLLFIWKGWNKNVKTEEEKRRKKRQEDSRYLFSSFWNAGRLALAFAAFDYS